MIRILITRSLVCCTQVWINQGDIVLLSLRDFQDDKADVIVKYTADEARNRTYRHNPRPCQDNLIDTSRSESIWRITR